MTRTGLQKSASMLPQEHLCWTRRELAIFAKLLLGSPSAPTPTLIQAMKKEEA